MVINPYVVDFKLYDEWMHPLGLYLLIDTLLANGYGVRYFDCLERTLQNPDKKYATGTFISTEIPKPELFNTVARRYKRYGCLPERFEQFLQEEPQPDVVFVGSMMTYWAEGVVATVETIRRVLPEIPVVVGGTAVRLLPEFFRTALPGVSVFTGDLSGDGSIELPGCPQPLRLPQQQSLLPGFFRAAIQRHGPALLSLGCPMHCSYCASNILQPEYRRRDMEVVAREITMMVDNFGVRDFSFYDDALLVDAKQLLVPFLLHIVGSGVEGLRLHTPNGLHLQYITAELLALMHEAGFTTLRFGYETGQAKHRRQTGGKADEQLLRSKLELVQSLPFPDTGVYVMGGLPESSPEEMLREMRVVASCGVRVKPVFLSPVPGTPLFEQYTAEFPDLRTDPRWQNDSFFVTRLKGWGSASVEEIRSLARELNSSLRG